MNEWLRAYFAVPFRIIGTIMVGIMDTYKKNRAWLDTRLAQRHAALSLQSIVVATFVTWMVIWGLTNL